MSITAFSFGEWLPDLPDLGNPGLTEALNVLPVSSSYTPFLPLSAIAGATLPAQPIGAIYPITASGSTTVGITSASGILGPPNLAQIVTSTTHGLTQGVTVVVLGNPNIAGTWLVYNVVNSTTFQILGGSFIPGVYFITDGSVTRIYQNTLIAGINQQLYAYESNAWTKRSASTYQSSSAWEFTSFDGKVIATNGKDVPQIQTVSGTNFAALATSGAAPTALALGVINRFAVLGNTSDAEYAVQWSAIDDPRNWPTPNSATAIATQSGRQYLSGELGAVQAIYGGDQIGIVLQKSGVTRMTYAGPPVVFQFDTISKTHGSIYKHASIFINGIAYFWSPQGFQATDGVSISPMGIGKVDDFFRNLIAGGFGDLIRTAHDKPRKLIYWCVPSTLATANQCDYVAIYNYVEKRWTHCGQVSDLIFTPASTETELEPWGFDSTHCLARFNGSPGTATFISGEVEPQPGGCALINGIKPVIASSGTAPTIGVQVGSRDDQGTTVSYSSTTSPTSRTGFADMRSDARYHRARVYITGNFDKALGLEIDATPTGGM